MSSLPDAKIATDAFVSWSGHVLDYAVLLAAVGTVSMAALELVKALTRARTLYHRRAVGRWLKGDKARVGELLDLTTGGDANAWYDQPADDLLEGIRTAATLVLQYPDLHPDLYRFLVSRALETDVALVWTNREPDAKDVETRQTWIAARNDARQRISHLVTQKIAALQCRIAYEWARANQAVAMLIAGAIVLVLLHQTNGAMPLLSRVGLALLGGLVAPFAKDIVSALSGAGTPALSEPKPHVGGSR